MIDPRRLRVLRALADHGTVTAAGRALHLTPSAVSQQLAALEGEVGHELLRRRGRRVWLTAAGELLVEHADAVMGELERAEARLALLGAGLGGVVRVAAFSTAITRVVAPAVRELPGDVALEVREAEAQQALPMLLDGEIDVAVTMRPEGDRRVASTPLYSELFDAVLPADHRLRGARALDLADLAEEEWVVPHAGNPCRDVVLEACRAAGFRPRTRHASDDFTAQLALVDAGAVALIPRTALPPGRGVGLVVPAARHVFALTRRGREEHPLIAAVVAALVAAAGQPGCAGPLDRQCRKS
ncbi:LysR family transcriptional regulator [Actinokineospora bangkokensis]|uniref:LysR family transcriptional regulator n=1 Tax=Actinokineospora bangkokensis TaxID=1193682 RepID=A0A1Q9LG65_9PSEU|nr:LysR family transcriptional regulator [Actinokineospora bangkokensis]OLR91037.1 LysR family transcriptional regulator [Actinokineospora bangkokensis]